VNANEDAEAYAGYARANFEQGILKIAEGSDVGAFIEGLQKEGPIVGLINMLANAFGKVLQSIEGVDMVLNPFTNLLMGLRPLIKALLLPMAFLSKGMQILGGLLEQILGFLLGPLNDIYDSLVETNIERKNEAELMRQLNQQYKDLYKSLKEQEEYYLQQRRHLNAEWAIEQFQTRNVNDMILTPHGNFSTDPDDYIIATKNPQSLGNSGGNVYVNVINNTPSQIRQQTETRADGAKQITIMVDQIVKNGLASGTYDGAMDIMGQRRSGMRVTQ
jgi:hypothetical protein